jgi:hypothetical protein
MKNIINSMYAQVIYMFCMGIGLLFVPNFILSLFGVAPTDEGWIRIIGALALALTIEYYAVIKQQNLDFFKGTVWSRYIFCGILVVLVLLNFVVKPVLVFAILEGSLGIWTHFALKNHVY